MNHLTVDDIIRFVSLKKLDADTLEFAAEVNGHIRNCEKCLNLVSAFQTLYDEFSRLYQDSDFKKYISEKFTEGILMNEKLLEVSYVQEELEDFR